MRPAGLDDLLILQERDQRRSQLEKILAHVPKERATIEARIAARKAEMDAAKQAVTELELKRKDLEATIRGLEDQVLRYRNQQLQVKKNDEYQALTHEIELTESKKGEAEETEIQILYDIDTERERMKQVEKEGTEGIAFEQNQLQKLAERERQIATDIEGVLAEVQAARAGVAEVQLARYDRLAKTIGLPAVVPMRDSKCGGCHLKVSSGVAAEVKKGAEIVACDNCSRLLYFEF